MGKTVRYFDKQEENTSNFKKKIKKKKNKNAKAFKVNLKSKKIIKKPNDVKEKLDEAKPKRKIHKRVPIDKKLLEKHSRGTGVNINSIRLGINKYKQQQREKAIEFSIEQSARTEILLTEQEGLLEAEEGETTTQFRQSEIVNSVDITSATKHFDLQLNDFGPYRIRYTRNGRHLLLGGRRGHVAAFDWITKRLHCELNVMESVHDVCWLHLETMMAVAQKDWVYIYDKKGIELHCLKKLNKVSRMDFLPYHFLLATASEEGYLSWLDISIGQMVSQYNSKQGNISLMCQNPWNAVLCVGGHRGVISMWTPNMRKPLVKLLCHTASMTAMHVDPKGLYLATAATDRTIKIWDIRKLEGPLKSYRVRSAANELSFSQKGLLGVAMGNVVEVYKDNITLNTKRAYLRHVLNTPVSSLSFCPFEDVLGVGSGMGFTSLLVPGAGEPNFDALEANPYQTKNQRKEAEVKALLDKIQPEFITLDPTVIADVDVPTLMDKIEAKKKLLYIKPPTIDFQTRKNKKHLSSVQNFKNKKIVQEQNKKEFLQMTKSIKIIGKNKNNATKQSSDNVLDRFLPSK